MCSQRHPPNRQHCQMIDPVREQPIRNQTQRRREQPLRSWKHCNFEWIRTSPHSHPHQLPPNPITPNWTPGAERFGTRQSWADFPTPERAHPGPSVNSSLCEPKPRDHPQPHYHTSSAQSAVTLGPGSLTRQRVLSRWHLQLLPGCNTFFLHYYNG